MEEPQHAAGIPIRTAASRLLRVVARVLLFSVALAIAAWTFGAIWFDGPFSASWGDAVLAVIWAVVAVGLMVVIGGFRRRLATVLVLVAVVWVPWSRVGATNDRDWGVYWRQLATVEVNGDEFTFRNFRDFRYPAEGPPVERWTTRTVSLRNLQAVDVFIDRFGGELIVHPMLSFDFGPDGHVALSIETRRETGESFSALGGLYKMFELQYLFGSEEDFVRQRIDRYGNPLYVYRADVSHDQAYALFINSVTAANDLAANPRFYDVISANCTTSYWQQGPARNRRSLDYRFLINGGLDRLLQERGFLFDGGLEYGALREQALINDTVGAISADSDLSAAIRAGRVGFGGGSREERRVDDVGGDADGRSLPR